MINREDIVKKFRDHYHRKFRNTELRVDTFEKHKEIFITSDKIKPGNEPRLFLLHQKVNHSLVLAHGLSDSPHYVSAIGRAFTNEGTNVVIPLMPAHGLKKPDEAMEDIKMESKWKNEIDMSTQLATQLGEIVSLGGFSSRGALCYNKILREPETIKGALFLFAAAIDVALISELGRLRFLSAIAKMTDGQIEGHGMDPFKYPKLPLFAALELGQIINQNEDLSHDIKIEQPVFAAHAIDDKTAKLPAIENLLKKHTQTGFLYTLANGMAHAELPLKDDVELDNNYEEGKPAYANKDFDLMMAACLGFYRKYVLSVEKKV